MKVDLSFDERIMILHLASQIQPQNLIERMTISNITMKMALNSDEIERIESNKSINIKLTNKELLLLKDHLESSQEITDELFVLLEKLNIT